jgi:hypothetical protein
MIGVRHPAALWGSLVLGLPLHLVARALDGAAAVHRCAEVHSRITGLTVPAELIALIEVGTVLRATVVIPQTVVPQTI